MQQFFQKIITLSIILSVIFTPLVFAKEAKAQNISAYMTGLAPAIARLPLCKKATGAAGIKGLFMKQGEVVAAEQAKEYTNSLSITPPGLEEQATGAASDAQTLPVNLSDPEKQALFDTRNYSKDTNQKMTSLEANDTCLKSIGRLVIKMLLQKMTLATVDWINNGFDGGPAFIQDSGQFFGDIAKNEILQFGGEINNPELFPFGRAFMENQANAFKNKFADNARYSLNELIKDTNPEYSAETFSQDFSKGGWNAWTYMTQVPANNPLGFQLMASNELQKRLAGTEQSNAQNMRDSLKESDGFLGDYRCADPGDYITKEEHQKALAERSASSMGPYQYELCKRWEYVTPGSMIAKVTTDLVKYPENNLLKAEDLNDAVAAIMDALINRFSNDIMSDGFVNFSKNVPSGASAGNFIIDENNLINYGATTVTSDDYPEYIIEASSWLKQNPNFNIRTDLNQALIDEQRTYIDKLTTQNKELNDLMAVTRQLDYCIPGPHPGWEEDSSQSLNSVISSIPPYTEGVQDVGGVIAQLFDPISGTVSTAYNYVTSLFENENGTPQEKYYAAAIDKRTGIQPNANGKVESMQQVDNILNTILHRYAVIIEQIYTKNPNMPLVTEEAKNEFLKIPGYQKIIDSNVKKINTLKGIVGRLTTTKQKVDDLNNKLASSTLSQEEYETELAPYISSFGRMSADMVSGDNIANADNIMKQARDKKKYIYNDLLKGPMGCEQDLSTGEAIHLPWQFAYTKRMPYPYPILYDYNILKGGDPIPDPWNSGYQNTMVAGNNVNTVGPGFLSWTVFSRDDTPGTGAPNNTWQLQPDQFSYLGEGSEVHPWILTLFLDSDDTTSPYERIVDRGNSRNITVGKNTCSDCNGLFERTINVY